ncbi:MAG TPA: FAD-dependent oxidoreductase, partial [Acidobacteriaceae bacterium]|nr:FAD-dependent oxidoreductase [Acidobacteriaceae bacterium]
MTDTYDVVVVGAGIMGAATAWQLARRGRRVALIEQFDLGHVRGSSHGAARIFRFAYDEPDYVRLAQMALPIWREAEAELGRDLLHLTGGLDFGPPETLGPVARALDGAA